MDRRPPGSLFDLGSVCLSTLLLRGKAEQYPPEYGKHTGLNPSTGFIRPGKPALILAQKDS